MQSFPKLYSHLQKVAGHLSNKPCLVLGEKTLSYQQLFESVDQLSKALISTGITSGAPLCLILDNKLHITSCILAALKIDCHFVPLSKKDPVTRLSHIIMEIEPSLIISTSEIKSKLSKSFKSMGKENLSQRITTLQDLKNKKTIKNHLQEKEQPTKAGDLVYIMYTSGSTGKPKGVMVSNDNLINLLDSFSKILNFTNNDVFLSTTNYVFDIFLIELLLPLYCGSKIIFCKDKIIDGMNISNLCNQHNVTYLQATPAIWNTFIQTGLKKNNNLNVICGGDIVTKALAKTLIQNFKTFWFAYGITETTVYSTISQIKPDHKDLSRLPLGSPIKDTTLHILDNELKPTKTGESGILFIGGSGVSKGYVKQPNLTASKFIRHPLEKNSYIYNTGDRVIRNDCGEIFFIGRQDTQIKRNGFRIDLEEIAQNIASLEEVYECTVLAKSGKDYQTEITSYILPEFSQREKNTPQEKALEKKYIDFWKSLYNQTYLKNGTLNKSNPEFTTWISSYTDEKIPSNEMQEWLQHTTNTILHQKPINVFEIGFGDGSLLFRLAGKVKKYKGIDISNKAYDIVRKKLNYYAYSEKITIDVQNSIYFSDSEKGMYDTFILNSVIQYFPSLNSLKETLNTILNNISTTGQIFIGDIQSYSQLPFRLAMKQLSKYTDNQKENLFDDLLMQTLHEEEFVVDPTFFQQLSSKYSQISHINIILKRGKHHNEMTCFRYDVLIHVNKNLMHPHDTLRTDWSKKDLNLNKLELLLNNTKCDTVVIDNIPNTRHSKSIEHLKFIIPEILALDIPKVKLNKTTIDPEILCQLFERNKFNPLLTWSSDNNPTNFSLVADRDNFPYNNSYWSNHEISLTKAYPIGINPISYSNDPLFHHKFNLIYKPEIKRKSKKKLPPYLYPDNYIPVTHWPLNKNGKIDKNTISRIFKSDIQNTGENINNEKTPIIKLKITNVFNYLLNTKKINPNTNFIDQGISSLLLVQAQHILKSEHNIDIPLMFFFTYPNVTSLFNQFTKFQTLDKNSKPVETKNIQKKKVRARRKNKKIKSKNISGIIGKLS